MITNWIKHSVEGKHVSRFLMLIFDVFCAVTGSVVYASIAAAHSGVEAPVRFRYNHLSLPLTDELLPSRASAVKLNADDRRAIQHVTGMLIVLTRCFVQLSVGVNCWFGCRIWNNLSNCRDYVKFIFYATTDYSSQECLALMPALMASADHLTCSHCSCSDDICWQPLLHSPYPTWYHLVPCLNPAKHPPLLRLQYLQSSQALTNPALTLPWSSFTTYRPHLLSSCALVLFGCPPTSSHLCCNLLTCSQHFCTHDDWPHRRYSRPHHTAPQSLQTTWYTPTTPQRAFCWVDTAPQSQQTIWYIPPTPTQTACERSWVTLGQSMGCWTNSRLLVGGVVDWL